MVSWTHPEKAVSRLNSDALVTQLPSSSRVKISDINVAMIAIFYIGDCISDLAKAIERRSEK